MYPACEAYINGSNPDAVDKVLANLDGDTGVNAGAALSESFGMALWLAFAMHAFGVELYVSCPDSRQSYRTTNNSLAQSHPSRGGTSTKSQLPKAARSRHAQPWICRTDRRSLGRCGQMGAREGEK